MSQYYRKMPKLYRMLTLFSRLLQGKYIGVKKTAEDFHVGVRSIQRDIAELRIYFADVAVFEGEYRTIVYDRQRQGYILTETCCSEQNK